MTKKITECQLYLYAHLLAGKPDLDLPWDPDLQQEKNKAQQSSRRHAHTMKVSLTSNSNFTQHSITREECSALVQQAFLGTSQKNPFSLIPHSICQETTVQAKESSPAKLGCHFYRTEGFVPGSPTAPPHPASFSQREG